MIAPFQRTIRVIDQCLRAWKGLLTCGKHPPYQQKTREVNVKASLLETIIDVRYSIERSPARKDYRMTIEFIPVKTSEDRTALAALASEIWHEYWPALIGEAQTDYMVEQFQSLSAIERDIAEHAYEYWFLRAADDDRIVGYTGGHVESATNRFFISKIYLRAEERGRGFAGQTIRFYEDLCRTRGLTAMYLTVNKHNDLAIRAYLAKGFETIDSVETDIGQGFVMDDYIMEKRANEV